MSLNTQASGTALRPLNLYSPPYLKEDPSNLPDSFLFWFITNQITFLRDI